jgi:ADP-ribose pyrophosphatase YjhB (NUDIX family)
MKVITSPPNSENHPVFEKPLTTVDVVIFSLDENKLKVLLIKRQADINEPYPNQWALVGGFVDITKDADLKATAQRKLLEKTGVQAAYLEQLGSWGSAKRDPRGWSATHVYFSMLAIDHAQTPKRGANADDAQWFDVMGEGVSCELAFDHAEILAEAIHRLRNKVEYTSLPAFLMPELFTLKELQAAYEAVLARPLEKSAFRTRMLSTDLLEVTPNYKEAANRPAQLYRLKSNEIPVFFQRTFNPIK